MQPNGFPEEVKRLCSLICGETTWSAWVYSRSEATYLSARALRSCTIEERVLLKNLEQSHRSDAFSLPDGHVILQFTSASEQRLVFQHGQCGELTFLLALPVAQHNLLSLTLLLIGDRWKEWQLRLQLSKLVENQQQRILQAEERYRTLHQHREQHIRQLLQDWAQSQVPSAIVFDETIYTAFDFALADTQIREQLDHALQLAQFIQPGTSFFTLSAAHLQPVAPIPATIHTPLSSNQRVELLLDKYETSARLAQQNGFIVNGKTIAEHLQPSISPPAITDALKKNRKAIGQLLEQYPEKWSLLRKYLKPVKELNESAFYRAIDGQH